MPKFRVRPGLQVQDLDGVLLVLEPSTAVVRELRDEQAEAFLLARAGVDVAPDRLREALAGLIVLGLVEAPGWSRRHVLALGGAAAAATVAVLALPTASAAASSASGGGGAGSGGAATTTSTSSTTTTQPALQPLVVSNARGTARSAVVGYLFNSTPVIIGYETIVRFSLNAQASAVEWQNLTRGTSGSVGAGLDEFGMRATIGTGSAGETVRFRVSASNIGFEPWSPWTTVTLL